MFERFEVSSFTLATFRFTSGILSLTMSNLWAKNILPYKFRTRLIDAVVGMIPSIDEKLQWISPLLIQTKIRSTKEECVQKLKNIPPIIVNEYVPPGAWAITKGTQIFLHPNITEYLVEYFDDHDKNDQNCLVFIIAATVMHELGHSFINEVGLNVTPKKFKETLNIPDDRHFAHLYEKWLFKCGFSGLYLYAKPFAHLKSFFSKSERYFNLRIGYPVMSLDRRWCEAPTTRDVKFEIILYTNEYISQVASGDYLTPEHNNQYVKKELNPMQQIGKEICQSEGEEFHVTLRNINETPELESARSEKIDKGIHELEVIEPSNGISKMRFGF